MSPILAEDKLRRVSIVLMDIDGTMIRSNSDSFGNIMRQLRRLKPAGIRFSIATGRTLYGCQRVIRELQTVHMRMPPMIAYNGGVVAWPEDTMVISRNSIPMTVLRRLFELAKKLSVVPLAYACRETWNVEPRETVYGQANLFYRPDKDFNGMPIRWLPNLSELDSNDIAAVLIAPLGEQVDLSCVEDRIAEEFGDQLRITRSGSTYIEIAHPDSTKKHAMTILTKPYNKSLSDIMAIGDNYNDLEMLQAAGVGVAVANAPEDVKRAADYICLHEASEGVVEILRRLLSSKRAAKRKMKSL